MNITNYYSRNEHWINKQFNVWCDFMFIIRLLSFFCLSLSFSVDRKIISHMWYLEAGEILINRMEVKSAFYAQCILIVYGKSHQRLNVMAVVQHLFSIISQTMKDWNFVSLLLWVRIYIHIFSFFFFTNNVNGSLEK